MKRKAPDTWAIAEQIRKQIEALPADTEPMAAVVEIFRSHPAEPSDKGDAFWMLDSQPGRFSGYAFRDTGWFAKLRKTRNHPEHGPAMFATFRS